ncbi:MAG: exosome complex exonuclease Rrp41 [archaeon]
MGGSPLPEGVYLWKDGKRCDGRTEGQMRPFKIEAGVLERAEGSAYVEIGGTHAYAAVYGPRELHPKHMQQADRAVLKTVYEMAPFSVSDRKRPGPDRRSKEIAKVTRECLEPMLYLEEYPKAGIDLHIEIVQADAGTRVAGITAASVALADAGIRMRDLVAACSAGKIEDKIVLDLCGIEDNFGSADVPVAYSPAEDKITLLQMDGLLTKEELKTAMDYAIKGCKDLYVAQKDALRRRYK